MPELDLSWGRFVEEVSESPGHEARRAVRAAVGLHDAETPLVLGDGSLRDEEFYRARIDAPPHIYLIWSRAQRYWREWQSVRQTRASYQLFAGKAKSPAPQPEVDPIDDRAALLEMVMAVIGVLAYADEVCRYEGAAEKASLKAACQRLNAKLDELRRRLAMPAESASASLAGTERSIASSGRPGEGLTVARRAG